METPLASLALGSENASFPPPPRLEKMGPRDGGVVGEGADEPERSERAFVAGVVGMRRSEEARVSEEAVRRKGGGGGPRE